METDYVPNLFFDSIDINSKFILILCTTVEKVNIIYILSLSNLNIITISLKKNVIGSIAKILGIFKNSVIQRI